MKFIVTRLKDGTLTTNPLDYPIQEFTIVGEFDADVHCDFIMNMIRINEQEGRCDKSLTKLEKKIEREGI